MHIRQGSNALDSSSSAGSSALSSFASLRISLPLATDPSLRGGVTLCDCSKGQGQFVQIEPCLNELIRHTRRGRLCTLTHSFDQQ